MEGDARRAMLGMHMKVRRQLPSPRPVVPPLQFLLTHVSRSSSKSASARSTHTSTSSCPLWLHQKRGRHAGRRHRRTSHEQAAVSLRRTLCTSARGPCCCRSPLLLLLLRPCGPRCGSGSLPCRRRWRLLALLLLLLLLRLLLLRLLCLLRRLQLLLVLLHPLGKQLPARVGLPGVGGDVCRPACGSGSAHACPQAKGQHPAERSPEGGVAHVVGQGLTRHAPLLLWRCADGA